MTRYFSALLVFMFSFSILGLGMDFISSAAGLITTAAASLGLAVVAYFAVGARE